MQKCSTNVFSELGLPGVGMVNGLCRMCLNYARPSQLPYNEKSSKKLVLYKK